MMKKKNIRKSPSIPTHPLPNGASPRNCGPVQEGEQGVQMHKSTLLGNEDFHLKKNKHEKTSRCFCSIFMSSQGVWVGCFCPKIQVFFCSLFHDFFQVSNTKRSNQLLTDGKSVEQMIQSCSLKKQTFQILGMFMQFTQKTPITWTMIITEPQLVALECFPRLKRGQIASRRGVGCFWNYIGSLDNANLVEAKGR